jgi:hypothetical protein
MSTEQELERLAHDAVLSWCRKKGGGFVMRNPYGTTDCVVFDLNRTRPKPGSTWERIETELARCDSWLAVAMSLRINPEGA